MPPPSLHRDLLDLLLLALLLFGIIGVAAFLLLGDYRAPPFGRFFWTALTLAWLPLWFSMLFSAGDESQRRFWAQQLQFEAYSHGVRA